MLKLLWTLEGIIISSLVLVSQGVLFVGMVLLLVLAVIVGIILFGAVRSTSIERSLE